MTSILDLVLGIVLLMINICFIKSSPKPTKWHKIALGSSIILVLVSIAQIFIKI